MNEVVDGVLSIWKSLAIGLIGFSPVIIAIWAFKKYEERKRQ